MRPLVFSWLIKILNSNKSIVNIESSISKYIIILLDLVVKNNPYLQYQSLEFLLSIVKSVPKALIKNEDKLIKSLITILNDENGQLLLFIYEILNSVVSNSNIDINLIQKAVEETVKLINSHKLLVSAISPILLFLEISSKKLDQTKNSNHLAALI